MVVGIAVLATNLVAAGWGVIGWLRKDARASIVFWPLLRLAQATVVIQAVIGFLLVARGASSPDGLHIVVRRRAARGRARERGDASGHRSARARGR